MKLTPQQSSIFNGLRQGRKLSDLMRQPGMPTWADFERWRKQPAFERTYQQALSTGKPKMLVEAIGLDDAFSGPRPPAVLRGPRTQAYRPHPEPEPVTRYVPKTAVPRSIPEPVQAEEQPLEVAPVFELAEPEKVFALGFAMLAEPTTPSAAEETALVPEPSLPAPAESAVVTSPPVKKIAALTRYFYLEKPTQKNPFSRVKFVYHKKEAGGSVRVYFNTPLYVEAANWDLKTKTLKPTAPDAVRDNALLDVIHELAMVGIAEGKTQDEIRILLDFPPANGIPHQKPAKTRTKAPVIKEVEELTYPAPLPLPAPQPLAMLPVEQLASPPFPETQDLLIFHPLLGVTEAEPEALVDEPFFLPVSTPPTPVMSEPTNPAAQPFPISAELLQLFNSGEPIFLTSDGQVYTSEEKAVAGAWTAARESGVAVDLYSYKTTALGKISPPMG